jgi:hypothetical protein
MSDDLLQRLRKVEPDKPGERTRWYRNPDGPDAADEIERLREDMRRIAFNALKRHMILGDSREEYIQMMEANNNLALWQCLEYVGRLAAKALGEGKE